MRELKTDELKKVGGGFLISLGSVALAALGTPFLAGLLDGICRPLPCTDWR